MDNVKPRVRVRAGEIAFPQSDWAVSSIAPAKKVSAQYLRGDSSGILHMRRAITRDAKVDVREAAGRASALANQFIQNSGWIAGAVDQILADTIGEELKLNARPDLTRLGYDENERAAWCREVEAEWRRWAWDPAEVDLAGRCTFAEILDGVMRHYLAYGEAIGIVDYLTVRGGQRRYGIETGTKVSLIAPHRLPRTTIEYEGLEDGIYHDANGRALSYNFRKRVAGSDVDVKVSARDVIHVMDRGENPGATRGISPLAPILKVIAQYDQLADATLATALMQTIFAATIKSPEPSETAFQAIQTLKDTDCPDGYDPDDWSVFVGGLQADLVEVWGQRLDALRENGIHMGDTARINHLAPGEEFNLHTANTPGSQYLPYSQSLLREMARRLGVASTALTMDHSNATYSSTRMEYSSIWPIVSRRRTRIVTPFADRVYAEWLDEMIGTGRIQIKGGYEAFKANQSRVTYAEWQGPPKPSADDYKAAMAAKVRLELGITSLADECADYGRDWEENALQIEREIKMLEERGVPHPFGRPQGGGAGPNGAAADGNRTPAKGDDDASTE